MSVRVKQKAEAEASGLFSAFAVTHCSPFLETRPVPRSVLLAEIKACASALSSLRLLSEGETNASSVFHKRSS